MMIELDITMFSILAECMLIVLNSYDTHVSACESWPVYGVETAIAAVRTGWSSGIKSQIMPIQLALVYDKMSKW